MSNASKNEYRLVVDLTNIEQYVSEQKQEQQQEQQANWGKFVKTQVVRPFISQTTNLISSQIGLMTGQQQLQERWNFGLQAVQGAYDMYSGIVGSVATGRALGLGKGASVGVGLALMALKTSMDLASATIKVNNMKTLENAQIRQTEERAGWAFNKTRQGG